MKTTLKLKEEQKNSHVDFCPCMERNNFAISQEQLNLRMHFHTNKPGTLHPETLAWQWLAKIDLQVTQWLIEKHTYLGVGDSGD